MALCFDARMFKSPVTSFLFVYKSTFVNRFNSRVLYFQTAILNLFRVKKCELWVLPAVSLIDNCVKYHRDSDFVPAKTHKSKAGCEKVKRPKISVKECNGIFESGVLMMLENFYGCGFEIVYLQILNDLKISRCSNFCFSLSL
jgi:hypothetical protein